MKKRNQCLIIILSLIIGLIYPIPETTIADAAGAPKISASSVVLFAKDESKTIYVRNIKKKKIKNLTVKSQNESVAEVWALSKTSFGVIATCDDGYTKVSVKLKLKKKVKGKKEYSFVMDVDVVAAEPQPTGTPEVTAGPTSTPTTATAAPTASVVPSPTPTAAVKPTATPTATPTVLPTASPAMTESPYIVPSPTSAPTTSPATSPTTSPDESAVYSRMIAMKSEYPEGKPWTNDNKYKWVNVTAPHTTYNFAGCAAFAAIISDAGFGKETKAKTVTNPDPSTVRVGDILRVNNDSHSVIVLEIEADCFIIAEGNYNNSVHWGRKIYKTEPIDELFTRW